MTTTVKLHGIHGIIRGRSIELQDDVALPEGTAITVDIAIPDLNKDIPQLPPELEAMFGSLAHLGDEVDEFNRWYREARHAEPDREIDPE